MRFAVVLALLGALAAVSGRVANFGSADNEKTDVFFFPSFGAITSIDFDQLIRSEMARENRERLRGQRQMFMKRSIAIGRAGFRPGKRAVGPRRIPRLSMVLFNR